MRGITAGKFTVELSEPFPIWVGVKDDCGNEIRCSHRDLADLAHVVERVRAAVRYRLASSISPHEALEV